MWPSFYDLFLKGLEGGWPSPHLSATDNLHLEQPIVEPVATWSDGWWKFEQENIMEVTLTIRPVGGCYSGGGGRRLSLWL